MFVTIYMMLLLLLYSSEAEEVSNSIILQELHEMRADMHEIRADFQQVWGHIADLVQDVQEIKQHLEKDLELEKTLHNTHGSHDTQENVDQGQGIVKEDHISETQTGTEGDMQNTTCDISYQTIMTQMTHLQKALDDVKQRLGHVGQQDDRSANQSTQQTEPTPTDSPVQPRECGKCYGFETQPQWQYSTLRSPWHYSAMWSKACRNAGNADYVINATVTSVEVTDSKEKVTAIVDFVAKKGNDLGLLAGNQIHLIKNYECACPSLENGKTYLIMGMDGIVSKNEWDENQYFYFMNSDTYVAEYTGNEWKQLLGKSSRFAKMQDHFMKRLAARGCPT